MSRIVNTVGSKNGKPKRLVFDKCVVTEIKHTQKGFVLIVNQRVTPYYNYGNNADDSSFFKTGRSLLSRYGNISKELEGWTPYNGTVRKGRCFIPTDAYFTEGMELDQDYHIRFIKTNYPTYTGQRFFTDEAGNPVLDAKGSKIYYTSEFLDHYEEDLELGSKEYKPDAIQQLDNESLEFTDEELAIQI